MSTIYLASPYSHTDPAVTHARFKAACRAAAKLMGDGHAVFSPIAHSHVVADELPDALRLDHEFWMAQDLPILERCERVIVLKLDGWLKSRGVGREILHAVQHGIPVEYMEPA
jgi:hypothetical protein